MRSAPSEFSIAWPPSMPIRQETLPAAKLRSTSAAVYAIARLRAFLPQRRCTRSICSSAYVAAWVRDVVVAVDERDGTEDANGLSAVILRGQVECWNGGKQRGH